MTATTTSTGSAEDCSCLTAPARARRLPSSTHAKRRAIRSFIILSAETEILGLAVANAVKTPLAESAQSSFWQPVGAKAAATCVDDADSHSVGFFGFHTSLREWARLAP